MKLTKPAFRAIFGCSAILLSSFISGCSQDTTNLSEEREKAFKGGPMPPEAKRAMEKGMAEAAQKAASNAGANASRNQGR